MNLDCSVRADGYAVHNVFLDKIFYICGDDSYNTPKKIFEPNKKYFIYTIAGSGVVVVDDTVVTVTANTYMHIVPTERFSYHTYGENWEFWWYEYKGVDLAMTNTIYHAAQNSQIAFLLEHSFHYSQEGAWDVACAMFLALCALLDHCSILYYKRHEDSGLFRVIDKYIRDNLKTITVLDLVQHFKMEERSLRNFFHRQCNLPPKQYILKLRLEETCRLMLGTRRNLQSIAVETGFSSAYHLSRCFKKQFSIAPSQYRKKG